MLVDLNQKFVGYDGRIMRDILITEDKEGEQIRTTKDLALRRVVNLALTDPADQKMSGDTKIKCFNLLLQVIASKVGIVELESDDVTFIKGLIKPRFGVIVVGEAMLMLEGKDIGIAIIDEIPIADQDETKPELKPGISIEDLDEGDENKELEPEPNIVDSSEKGDGAELKEPVAPSVEDTSEADVSRPDPPLEKP